MCDNCGRPGHLSSQCTSSVQCHCCGSSDHTKKDCPRRGDRCRICSKVGHLAAKCREAVAAPEGQACFVLLETRLTTALWPSDWRAWVRGVGGGGLARVKSVYSSGEAAELAARSMHAAHLRNGEGWEECGKLDTHSSGERMRSWVLRLKPTAVGLPHQCYILTVQSSTLDRAR